jgi:hypothetical protein
MDANLTTLKDVATCSGRMAGSLRCSFAGSRTGFQNRRRQQRRMKEQRRCMAAMGIGFTVDSDSGLALPEKKNVVSAEYGLTIKQMQVLGLTNDDGARPPPIEAVSSHCYTPNLALAWLMECTPCTASFSMAQS